MKVQIFKNFEFVMIHLNPSDGEFKQNWYDP